MIDKSQNPKNLKTLNNPDLSIIIPAHNDEQRIKPTLEAYSIFFNEINKKEKIKYEIIVVINNTQDNTLEVVEKARKNNKNIKILNFKEGGKGFAVREGFKEALEHNSELIGFVDADMATTPEAYYDLIKNINGYDGIIASRWEKGAKIKRGLDKYVRSRGFNFLVKVLFLFPYKDTQCGAKIFKKATIDKIINKMYITKWAFDVNLLYLCKINKFKIKEWPTIWDDKEGSKIQSLKVPIQMTAGVIRLRLLYSPFKNFIRIYDKMPEWIKMHHSIK